MSKVFWVENKQSVLGAQQILTAREALALLPGLESHSYDVIFLNQALNRLQFIECGIVGQSRFLFQLSYNDAKAAYELQLPVFFTQTDWEIARDFLEALSNHLKQPIKGLEDFSLEAYFRGLLQECLADSSLQYQICQGIFHPVYLDRESLKTLLASQQILVDFDQLVAQVQDSSAYFAKVHFYRDQAEQVHGVYRLLEDLETVLPRHPFVPVEYVERVGLTDIMWEVQFVALDGDGQDPSHYQALASLDYDSFWDRLQADQYETLDANQTCIQPLSRSSLQRIFDVKA